MPQARAELSAPAADAIAYFRTLAERNGFSAIDHGGTTRIEAPLGTVDLQTHAAGASIHFTSTSGAKLQLLRDLYAQRFETLGLLDAVAWDTVQGRNPLNQVVTRVADRRRISPNFVRLRLEGGFDAFAQPQAGLHFRLLFGPEGPVWPRLDDRGLTEWPGGMKAWHRPPYTVRAIGKSADWIDVDVVLHEGGRVTAWCETVQVGDEIAIHGPNGVSQPEARWLGLVGDETALPVIARIVEDAPASTVGKAMIMVRSAEDAQTIPSASGISVTWERMDPESDPGPLLHRLCPPENDRFLFFAAEKRQARIARETFRAMGLSDKEAKSAGYWTRSGNRSDDN